MMHYWINISLIVLMMIISLILVIKSPKISMVIQVIGVLVLASGILFIFYPIKSVEESNPINLYLVGSGGSLPDSVSIYDSDVKVVFEDSVSNDQNSEENIKYNIKVLTPWENQYKLKSFLYGSFPVKFIKNADLEPPFVTDFYPVQNKEWTIQLNDSFYENYDSIVVNYDEKLIYNRRITPQDSELHIVHKFSSPGPVVLLIKLYDKEVMKRESKVSLLVKPATLSKIALFTRHPNSEFNTLLRWLEDEGFEYFYRTEISKDRYINKKVGSIDPYLFNSEWLDQFDLFIISSDAFNSYQWSMLTDKVLKKGKGLIITGDNKRGINIPLNYLGGDISAFWQEGERNPFELTAGNKQAQIEKSDLRGLTSTGIGYSIFKDSDLRGLTWPYFITGSGRMTVMPFEKTYDLILKNEKHIYDLIWHAFINNVSYEDEKYPKFLNYPYISAGHKEELFVIDHSDKALAKSSGTDLAYLPYLSIIHKNGEKKGWEQPAEESELFPGVFIYDQDWPEFEYINNKIETSKTIQAHNRGLENNKILISKKKDPGWLSISLILIGLTLMWAGPKI
ncbi:hypothetical protein OO013_19730 [Mangrovivirga sp. M17]|uniref:Uncharacterized protein n=1 Tax=Mangrovivirga halotolerans TaxID=2993936 RepID=A0ABT3RWF8_9BACT|nr:hypothetical protein [Mangrovivirga halotolerans]MCX2746119.1 hypothetical protein [Mangrovivirga halotolerans]